ncbi:MAG: hypothetical protein LBS36_12390 [Oscillospiraceae bacterium]|jgi:cyclic beta-1,2-glucan synthetase|nr:hypothetical protein [Oscillospiraceae bacterium]
MHHLIKKLKKELHIIRKAYKRTLVSESTDILWEWLADNYYILEREGRSAIKALKNAPHLPESKGRPNLYGLCRNICRNGTLPSAKALEDALRQEPLTIAESETLPAMLKAVLVSYAAADCRVFPRKHCDIGESSACINAIKSFRRIQDIDFMGLIENTSEVEKILSLDPSGHYPQMDDATRSRYRHAVAAAARSDKTSEKQAAEQALTKARQEHKHIGQALKIYPQKAGRRAKSVIALEILMPALAAFSIAVFYKKWYLFSLLLLPFWEMVKVLTDAVSRSRARPATLPRMELHGRIPDDARTMITISTLLPSAAKAARLEKHLSQLYRSNASGAVTICVLADLKGADTPTKPSDEADVEAAKRVIAKLNTKYGGGFLLAVRERVYSSTQREYTGSERKRGAILALCDAVKGDRGGFLCLYGDLKELQNTKYLMALDADTQMPLSTLSDLVACAVHPLNKPMLNEAETRVVRGYGIYCPRIETSIESASKTAFAQAMSGTGGITAYNAVVSDRYQDLFHHGLFTGKGLIDIAVLHKTVKHRLPAQSILSHDILEGEICRTANVADVQLTDSFPSNENGYMARLHRWVRGDWQNMMFLRRRIKVGGKRTDNPLKGISKFKIFDNLRRSLTPAVSVIALVLSFFMPKPAAFAVVLTVLLSAAFGNLLAGFSALFTGGISMLSRLYYSGALPSALSSFIKAALSVMMLAQTGFVCLDAIARALYRQAVSRRNLLEWVTAADADAAGTFGSTLKKYWKSGILGILLIFFSSPVGRLLGIAFLVNILFSVSSAREQSAKSTKISPKSTEKLTSYAAAMWKFYDEYCRSGDNFLPPDNVQETPVHRIAHRTSPTNIGLMLCCILAARDLGFIDTKSMYSRLKNALDSIEKLEKWNGNLLNWYNTKTLRPLTPKYCSAVDSGNFLCCLVALYQGLAEYLAEHPQIQELRTTLARMLKECDLSVFYNKQRALFHIGYDFADGRLSNSYYDLLMSEARMLSYYAVSTHSVPKKHWGALGRTLAKDGRYIGPISWTGTMFEYFMPCLFLPAPANTLISEGLRFCLRCQKNRTKARGIPYGISESGFYAFDGQLNYQYKAHGVQKLGLKRNLNSDLVISPYSTFLTLGLDPYPAIKNLGALEALDLSGRFGFYEAVDFTKSRVERQEYAVVRSYMAHHVGMSLLSTLNLLNNNCMQKRFMRDERMAAGLSLLEEKVPSEAAVFKDVEKREMPGRPERYVPQKEEFSQISPLQPKARLLSNGEWSVVVADTGVSVSLYRGADITRRSTDTLQYPLGVFAALDTGEEILPLTKAPFYNASVAYEAHFSSTNVCLHAKSGAFECKTETMLHRHLPVEQRSFTVKNNGKQTRRCKLLIYFEPSLSDFESENTHPAFANLFLKSSGKPADGLIFFSRQKRSSPETLSLAVGFCEEQDFVFDTAREEILKRPYGVQSLFADSWALRGTTGGIDNCCAIETEIEVPAKGGKTLNLLLSGASTNEEAAERLLKVRREKGVHEQKCAPSPFKTDSLDGIAAAQILPQIFMYPRTPKQSLAAILRNERGIDALWRLGISGDEPIICARADAAEDISNIIPLIRVNKKLARCGISTTLALLYNESEGYTSDFMGKLRETLVKEHCEQLLFSEGGVVPVNEKTAEPDSVTAVLAAAVYVFPEQEKLSSNVFTPFTPVKVEQGDLSVAQQNGFTENGYKIANKAPLPWCITLSNPTFGTLVSDSSPGYTWAINSRENKLTPWSNNTMRDLCGERLYLRTDGKIFNMLQNATAEFSAERAVFTGSVGAIAYRVQIEVPERGMKKEVTVSLENRAEGEFEMETAYYIEGVLADSQKHAKFIKKNVDEEGWVFMRSPYNTEYAGVLAFGSRCGAEDSSVSVCMDKAAFLMGKWDAKESRNAADPCAVSIRRIKLPPFHQDDIRYILSFGKSAAAAKAVRDIKSPPRRERSRILLSSPDPDLDGIFNSFLVHQIISTRIEARTGFFQCGGAYGFRDQLQDASALVLTHPEIVRTQILRCCAVQFREGDVLHWWHVVPQPRFHVKGVRTRYSDDLLWLAYVTAEYVLKTGDTAFLQVKTPYLSAMELLEEEHDRFFKPDPSPEKATVYEHCQKAVERTSRLGKNGLPLIGGGDWNDSFNKVGENGRGESVWLGQFLALTLKKFADVSEMIEDTATAEDYRRRAEELLRNVDEKAWNGNWYLRAFYDDGSPMGYAGAPECEIDLLPQSFAVLAGMGDRERRRTAMQSAFDRLVDEENGIIKLFTPPFTEEGKTTGYVNAYPEGIRENGGQYTHAATWFAKALFQEGMTEEGWRVLKILNPAKKYRDPVLSKKYKTEPYALAGDVYSAKGMEGRGGWSLYTGAAGWFYRTVYEDMLGIKQEKGLISVEPNMPQELKGGSTVTLFLDGAVQEHKL